MLLELPITLGVTVVASVLTAPGVGRLLGWTQGDGLPYQPSAAGAVAGLVAFLLLTLWASPEALADGETRRSAATWSGATLALGLYFIAGAAGGLMMEGPMQAAFGALTLLLVAVVLRYAGQCVRAYRRHG